MVARFFFSILSLFIFYFCRRDNVRGPRTTTLQHNSKTVWPEYCLCLPQRLQDGSGRSAERLRQRCVDGPTSSTLFRSDRSPSFVYFLLPNAHETSEWGSCGEERKEGNGEGGSREIPREKQLRLGNALLLPESIWCAQKIQSPQ